MAMVQTLLRIYNQRLLIGFGVSALEMKLSPSVRGMMRIVPPLLCCLFVGCNHQVSSSESEKTTEPTTIPEVEYADVRYETWPETVPVQGNLVPDDRSAVSCKRGGIVESILVEVGSRVDKGAPLVQIDAREAELRVSLARASLEQARVRLGLSPGDDESKLKPENAPNVTEKAAIRDELAMRLERSESLLVDGIATPEEIEQVRSAKKAADASYDSARNAARELIAQLVVLRVELELALQFEKDLTIQAPFEGIVVARNIAKGDHVTPGGSLLTIIRDDVLRFRFPVPERFVRKLKIGQQVDYTPLGESSSSTARISRFPFELDPASRTMLVEADIENKEHRIPVGLFATGHVIVNPEAEALVIPERSVRTFAGIEKVWLITEGTASEVKIETGIRRDGVVQVLSGLKAGDRIATNPDKVAAGKVHAVPAASVTTERPKSVESTGS